MQDDSSLIQKYKSAEWSSEGIFLCYFLKNLLKKIIEHVFSVSMNFKMIFTNRQNRISLKTFKPKRILKRPIVNEFPGVILLAWKLVLLHLKVLTSHQNFLTIGIILQEKMFSRLQLPQ